MGDERPAGAAPGRGATRLVLALVSGGLVWLAVGRVTVVPFLDDERRVESVRSIWVEATRQLPDTAFPSVMSSVFWLCAVGTFIGGVALALILTRIDDHALDAAGADSVEGGAEA